MFAFVAIRMNSAIVFRFISSWDLFHLFQRNGIRVMRSSVPLMHSLVEIEEAEAVVVEEEEMVMVKRDWSDVIQDVLEYERKSCRVFVGLKVRSR